MTNSSKHEDRQRFLRWLDHGSRLAIERKGERARHSDVIWSLLVEALEIIDRVPDQERRWLTSGTRSGGWNMIGMTASELKEIERLRILAGIKPFDGVSNYSPQRDDVERALDVLAWMRFCNVARNSERLIKAAVVLARSGETDAVYRIYRPNRRVINRQTIYEIKVRVTGFIIAGLNRQMAIETGPGISFKEAYS